METVKTLKPADVITFLRDLKIPILEENDYCISISTNCLDDDPALEQTLKHHFPPFVEFSQYTICIVVPYSEEDLVADPRSPHTPISPAQVQEMFENAMLHIKRKQGVNIWVTEHGVFDR